MTLKTEKKRDPITQKHNNGSPNISKIRDGSTHYVRIQRQTIPT